MTTVVAGLRPDLEFQAPGNKQPDAENQRQAWLRQMELSQIAMLQEADPQAGQTQELSPTKDTAAPRQPIAGQERDQGKQPEQIVSAVEVHQAVLLPVHPILPSHPANSLLQASAPVDAPTNDLPGTPGISSAEGTNVADAAGLNATAMPQAVSTTARPVPVEAASEQSAPVASMAPVAVKAPTQDDLSPASEAVAATGQAAVAVPVASAAATTLPAAQNQGVGRGVSTASPITSAARGTGPAQLAKAGAIGNPAGLEAENIPAQSAAIGTALSSAASAALAQPAVAASNAAPAQTVLQPIKAIELPNTMQSQLRNAAEPSGEAEESTESETAPVKRATTGSGETENTGEDWQKRMMHIAQDGQEISVSIRDTSLLQGQSMQVVYRLAADAAQSGLRLRTATVNGKTVLKSARDTDSSPALPNRVAAFDENHDAASQDEPHNPFQYPQEN